MPASEVVIRVGPLAPLAVSALYVAVAGLRDLARRRGGRPVPGVYPGSREQAGDLNVAWLRGLADARAACRRERVTDATAAAQVDAVQAAGLLADRARTNALFHP